MDFQTRYEFDPKKDLLGKGGFSKVYKASDILLERTVALKFFTAKTADKYQILNEIKKVIRFEHPNLCKYYDVALLNYKNVLDETEQMEVGIMEYIDAGDFKTYIRKHPEYTDKLLIDVLKGLAYLHKHGMAHRDLKPQNILIKMVDEEPVSKITDFGISKLVDSGDDANSSALLGTIEYMAPEQFNPKKYGINGRITTNLDLWSFGLLVYESVCHSSLFGSRSAGSSAEQVMANILSDMPAEKAESLPPKYREIVKRCLVKNAAERVQNALELIPLFQEGQTAEAPLASVPVYAQTDSGKISITETQVLTPPLPITGDVTQTLQPPPEPAELASEAEEPATEVFKREETAADIEEAALPQAMLAEVEAVPEEIEEAATQVVEPLSNAGEATQVLPQPPESMGEETQVLDVLRKKTEEEKAVAVEEASSEEPTQILSKSFAKPVVKEESNYDRLWTKTLNETGRRKAAQKAMRRTVLLVAALLLVVIFVAYPLLKSSSNADYKKPPIEEGTVEKKTPATRFAGPTTVAVAGGTFVMGDGAAGAPERTVTLDSFNIGEHEVTVAEFGQFMADTAYHHKTTAETKGESLVFVNGKWEKKAGVNWQYDAQGTLVPPGRRSLPVVHVSWTDAMAYCDWLSKKKKKKYRLPTEAEWEFAASGGNGSMHYQFSGNNIPDSVAWYKGNAGGSLHPVKSRRENELGLYDMSGNATEWCYDWFADGSYGQGPVKNPTGPDVPPADRRRVVRGGAWSSNQNICETKRRASYYEDGTGGSTGFRVCWTQH